MTFYDDPNELRFKRHLLQYCKRIEMARRRSKMSLLNLFDFVFRGYSYHIARHSSGEISYLVQKILEEENIDIVQIETFLLGPYIESIEGPPVVLDMHNVTWMMWERAARISKFPMRLFAIIEARRIYRDELRVCKSVDWCIPVSIDDLIILKSELGNGTSNLSVVTPGVDCDSLVPLRKITSKPNIVFVGSMHYIPNEDAVVYFCEEILPIVEQFVPDVTFTIVGAKPTSKVKNLAKKNNVVVTGFVDDVIPYYENSSVSVIPIRIAGGIRMKILEGLALGMPMVSTSIGCEGLDIQIGEELLIGDTPKEFAYQVVKLIQDKNVRTNISKQARKAAEEKFSWDISVGLLEKIYSRLVLALP